MEFVRNYSGLKIMLILLSMVVGLIVILPIYFGFNELTNLYPIFYVIVVQLFLTILLYNMFSSYINNIIKVEIKNKEFKHNNDFIGYLTDDKDFSDGILKKDVDIISNNEVIGTTTVYSKLREKFDEYHKKKNLS